MYVSKTPSPVNFRYIPLTSRRVDAKWFRSGNDMLLLHISGAQWDNRERLLDFSPQEEWVALDPQQDPGAAANIGSIVGNGQAAARTTAPAEIPPVKSPVKKTVVSYDADQTGFTLSRGGQPFFYGTSFGLAGDRSQQWILNFNYQRSYRFYGLGQKSGPLEHSGRSTTFWNLDVLGDYPLEFARSGNPDPLYMSIPYILMRHEAGWLGIFSNSMYRHSIALGADPHIEMIQDLDTPKQFYVSADDGEPMIYFIFGETAADVTRKLYSLTGVHQRPPVWSLGHHQSRWGYGSPEDLLSLREKFIAHKIPNDGLWLDIDYMDGYRVFSMNPEFFPSPADDIAGVQEHGHRVVPILDPGVKRDPEYPPFAEGVEKGYFCLNSSGEPYVGYVWPGETVFPDFSMEEVRSWWAAQVAEFAAQGIEGVWVDMNDPSTGSALPYEMLFRKGAKPHGYFHNAYALGMQMATNEGLQKAAPDGRPFVLSRSASPGTARYSAVWLGDNFSNYHHMAQTLITGMNLGLSGISFWGADVPGFADDTDAEMMIDWYKAAFLQPFLRNHSNKGTKSQEPWALGAAVRKKVRHFIELRYRMRPYLYNAFIAHSEMGDPVLTPLWYQFPEEFEAMSLNDTQFMVGTSVMQAPVLVRGQEKREVYLPQGWWFDASNGSWCRGGRTIMAQVQPETTPMYFREGSIIPMQRKVSHLPDSDMRDMELHVVLRKKSPQTAEYQLTSDDGETLSYTRGNETRIEVRAQAGKKRLELYLEHTIQGHGPLKLSVVVYDDFESVVLHSSSGKLHGKELDLKPAAIKLSGDSLRLARTKSFSFVLK